MRISICWCLNSVSFTNFTNTGLNFTFEHFTGTLTADFVVVLVRNLLDFHIKRLLLTETSSVFCCCVFCSILTWFIELYSFYFCVYMKLSLCRLNFWVCWTCLVTGKHLVGSPGGDEVSNSQCGRKIRKLRTESSDVKRFQLNQRKLVTVLFFFFFSDFTHILLWWL